MRIVAVCLVSALAVSGCMSTPYQPSGMTGGFRELQIKDNIWRVGFGGNGFTTRETVQTYWLYRSADLAIEKGYDGFEILSQIQLVIPLSPEQFFGTESPIRKTKGAPVYIPVYTGQTNHPAIEADLRFLKKPFEPAPPRIFDARELKAALDQYVNGKKCDLNSTTGNVCPHVHEYLFPKGKFDKPGT
jgi:hypothetical protein